MNALSAVPSQRPETAADEIEQLVTFVVDGQLFGISALKVRDVMVQQQLTRVPLARAEVAGALNLRGHIVTAIDVRARLGAPSAAADAQKRCVVVESGGDQFCLIVDGVGDVISIKSSEIEPNPGSLAPSWAQISLGVYHADGGELLLLLDVEQLLSW